MKTKTTTCLILAAGAFSAPSLFGAVLAQYNFANLSPSTSGAGVTATAISETGFTGVNTTTNVPGGSSPGRAVTLDQIENTFTGTDYFQFTLTPTAAGTTTLDLTNLTFAFNISASGAANESSFQLRYDNLADAAGFITVGETAKGTTTSTFNANFDLSGAAFNNLPSGITFRIDVKDSGSTAANASARIDTITVNGSVLPIPEPSALLLSAIGSLFLLRRRR